MSQLSLSSSSTTTSSSSSSWQHKQHPEPSYFLIKSEPSDYSIFDLQKDQVTEWDGVRNYAARNHLKTMNVGDVCLFYHSNCRPPSNTGIVGTCIVTRTAQPDPTYDIVLDDTTTTTTTTTTNDDDNQKNKKKKKNTKTNNNPWVSVLVQFESKWDTTVTLKELRAQATNNNKIIGNMTLLKQSRLSVMPISKLEWDTIHILRDAKLHGTNLLTEVVNITAEEEKTAEEVGGETSMVVTTDVNITNDIGEDDNHGLPTTTKTKTNANSSKKRTRTVTISTTTKSQTNKNLVDDPNYCSDPSKALTTSEIQTIILLRNDDEEEEKKEEDNNDNTHNRTTIMDVSKITEKELGLKGRKYIYKVVVKKLNDDGDDDGSGDGTGNNESNVKWVFQFDGAKFVGRDKKRLDGIMTAIKEMMMMGTADTSTTNPNNIATNDDDDGYQQQQQVYLILSPTSDICRRKTLPALIDDGVVVQRRLN